MKALKTMLKEGTVPHTLLFAGPSGCGKTTLARILANELKCSDSDLREINSADFSGIDLVRDIRSRMSLAPLGGLCRVYIIDECHELTSKAQNAFLKILEDTPEHVYFFLATTNPQKLIKPIRSRATLLNVKTLTDKQIRDLIEQICVQENTALEEEVIDKMVWVAEGAPRTALVLLNKIIDMQDTEDQLGSIVEVSTEAETYELLKVLLFKPNFRQAMKIMGSLQSEPESIRRYMLAVAANRMIEGKDVGKCYHLIRCFGDNYFDTGKAGLAASIYEVFHS